MLTRLLEKKMVESDSTGHYRLAPSGKREKQKKWLAPNIRKALERSGKKFEGVIEIEDEEQQEP